MSISAAALGRGIVTAVPARTSRPIVTEPARPVRPDESTCVFCPGRQDTVLASATSATGRSSIAVENRFQLTEHHELVLPHEHDRHLHRMGLDEMRAFTGILEQRARRMWHHAAVEHVSAWLSHGAQAGASQDHPHAQLAAWAQTPTGVLDELAQLDDTSCTLCRSVTVGQLGDVRVVAGHSLHDGELLLVPTQHGGQLRAEGHAWALAAAVRTLRTVFPECAYAVVWHAFAPAGRGVGHQHAHVLPRLTTLAAVNLIEMWTECRAVGSALADRARAPFEEHAKDLRAAELTT